MKIVSLSLEHKALSYCKRLLTGSVTWILKCIWDYGWITLKEKAFSYADTYLKTSHHLPTLKIISKDVLDLFLWSQRSTIVNFCKILNNSIWLVIRCWISKWGKITAFFFATISTILTENKIESMSSHILLLEKPFLMEKVYLFWEKIMQMVIANFGILMLEIVISLKPNNMISSVVCSNIPKRKTIKVRKMSVTCLNWLLLSLQQMST